MFLQLLCHVFRVDKCLYIGVTYKQALQNSLQNSQD